jgi:hypothetical protein
MNRRDRDKEETNKEALVAVRKSDESKAAVLTFISCPQEVSATYLQVPTGGFQ